MKAKSTTTSLLSSVFDCTPCSHRLSLFLHLLVRIIQIPRILILFMTHSERASTGQRLQYPSISSEWKKTKNKLFWGWVHAPHSALHGALGPKACFYTGEWGIEQWIGGQRGKRGKKGGSVVDNVSLVIGGCSHFHPFFSKNLLAKRSSSHGNCNRKK